ncbi:hypothetical protein Syun_009885 [Stephania yunnanensis]|uniref:Uncharacterized protein n=1 Tax=Stephania yunnanensis TaxID=152371 RepID=A0AAP0KFD8_9MAGN
MTVGAEPSTSRGEREDRRLSPNPRRITTINLAELKLKAEENSVDVQRRQKVKEAMLHAWTSYEKYAWGQDELRVGLENYRRDLSKLLELHQTT